MSASVLIAHRQPGEIFQMTGMMILPGHIHWKLISYMESWEQVFEVCTNAASLVASYMFLFVVFLIGNYVHI